MMTLNDLCTPSAKALRVLKQIVDLVRRDPDRFLAAGAALDSEFSTQGIRDRKATELRDRKRAVLREGQKTPNHKRLSRTYQRKHFSSESSVPDKRFRLTPCDAVPLPPMRTRDRDGVLSPPELPLNERFLMAFKQTFSNGAALEKMSPEQSRSVVDRRLLLAWLCWDPDRGGIKRITEFQELKTVSTDSGLGPIWTDGTNLDPPTRNILRVRIDGRIKRKDMAWIKVARNALNSFMTDPNHGVVPSFVTRLKSALELVVKLEGEPPAQGDQNQQESLTTLKKQCVLAFEACNRASEGLPTALQSVWTPTVGLEIAEMRTSIEVLRSQMAGYYANGFNHPIPRVSNAPQVLKDEWVKHENNLRTMIKRLPSLNLCVPSKLDTHEKSKVNELSSENRADAFTNPSEEPIVGAATTGKVKAKKNARTSKRRIQKRTPTNIQLETIAVVIDCGQNFAKAARILGKDPKTVKQNYDAGLKNAGKLAPKLSKPKTRSLSSDQRGQVDLVAKTKGDRVATADTVSQPARRRKNRG